MDSKLTKGYFRHTLWLHEIYPDSRISWYNNRRHEVPASIRDPPYPGLLLSLISSRLLPIKTTYFRDRESSARTHLLEQVHMSTSARRRRPSFDNWAVLLSLLLALLVRAGILKSVPW